MRLPLLALTGLCAAAQALAAPVCEARSGAVPLTVVELYTSEGCSSCPPADRWLSTLAKRADVLPLAFHVGYWDQLGWPDRFANPAYTQRQQQIQAATAGRYVYTPQVVVNGQDWRQWGAGVPQPAAAAAPPVSLVLVRDGATVTARITPAPGAHGNERLAGYWALLEDGHASQVRAGENAGETLKHDAVVRLYKPVAAWAAGQPLQLQFTLPAAGDKVRRVVFVVTDTALTRPVQALALGC
jgi:hypothetical protein